MYNFYYISPIVAQYIFPFKGINVNLQSRPQKNAKKNLERREEYICVI